jgi:hypothetical protein
MKKLINDLEKSKQESLLNTKSNQTYKNKSEPIENNNTNLKMKIENIKNSIFNFNKFSSDFKTRGGHKKNRLELNNSDYTEIETELNLNETKELDGHNDNNINNLVKTDLTKNKINKHFKEKQVETNHNHPNTGLECIITPQKEEFNNSIENTNKTLVEKSIFQKLVDFVEHEREKLENYKEVSGTKNNGSSTVSDIFNIVDIEEVEKQINNDVLNLPCIDAAEDNEGYYIPKLNEVINNEYLVSSIIGKGVFSCVLSVYKLGDKRNESALKILRNNELMRLSGEKEKAVLIKLNKGDPNGKN